MNVELLLQAILGAGGRLTFDARSALWMLDCGDRSFVDYTLEGATIQAVTHLIAGGVSQA